MGYTFRDKYREEGYVSVSSFSVQKILFVPSSFCAPAYLVAQIQLQNYCKYKALAVQ